MSTEEDQEVIAEAKEWLHRLSSKQRYRSHDNIEKVLELATEAINLLEDEAAFLRMVADGCEQSHDNVEQHNQRLLAVCDLVTAGRCGTA